eukprot:TRINITY_DN11325_c0_g2_i3.p1 TRINITY_DN11325_c0_g2~~TRINITY_DN11325_c0_g2_i3.p1  ORF type:complete len:460 (+),score=101.20 TRINITY_DN11325_c0_g2_i3:51-1430(+)
MAVNSGFFCPDCHQEFETPELLMAHSSKGCQTIHKGNRSSRWSAFIKKGKRAINGGPEDGDYDDDDDDLPPRFVEFAPQELGKIRSLTRKFRDKRNKRKENEAIEEARLIRHLEKLLFHGPSASSKGRKDFERSVINWADGKYVPACPECGKKFSMTRRQHHCRLCGSLICASCSLALDVDAAVVLTIPPQVAGAKLKMSHEQALVKLKGKLKIPGESMRICGFCQSTLSRKTEKQSISQRKKENPPVVAMYQEIQEVKKAVTEALPLYNHDVHRMCELGDTSMYAKISQDRDVLNKQLHRMSVYSKKLAGMLADKTKAAKYPSSHRLHSAIAKSWKEFVQFNTVAMTTLPPMSRIEQIAEEMEIERRRKIAEEQKRQQEEAIRRKQEREQQQQLKIQQEEATQARETLHMIQEQRDYLTMAMKKAKQGGRKDEVKMLQAQLKDVETFEAELKAKASLA